MPLDEASDIEARGSLRVELRAATADMHERVDEQMTRLLQVPRTGYGAFLQVSARGVLTIERSLEAANVAGLLPDWPRRARAAALSEDLASLSMTAPATGWLRLPDDEAFLFGILYVIEGSRLGARYLLRELWPKLLPQQRRAVRYLSHGQEFPLWQVFQARLETSQATRRSPARAIEGARFAFGQFLMEEV